MKRLADSPRLRVINLWAGPGAGKSTMAAGLFNLMKCRGYSVELVVEWAKEAVYEDRLSTLMGNQLYVFAKQDARLRRLIGKSTYAITDSPLPLSTIYGQDAPFNEHWFYDCVMGTWRSYENINVRVDRVKVYSTQGRTQTKEEAIKLDRSIYDLASRLCAPRLLRVKGDASGPHKLLDMLEQKGHLIPP